MRNLLWQFAALIGVTGVGILVVVQTMQGISNDPELSSQQAVAATDSHSSDNDSPIPKLPPLETTETVALVDPFGAEPGSSPSEAGNPFAARENPDQRAETEKALAPVPENPSVPVSVPESSSVTANDPPFIEPPPTSEPTAPSTLAESAPPQFPRLPAGGEAPNVDVFSDSASEAKTKEGPRVAGPFPTETENEDPFADPKPARAIASPKTNEIPFDPYESDPQSEAKAETPQERKTASNEPTLQPVKSDGPAPETEGPEFATNSSDEPATVAPELPDPEAAPAFPELPGPEQEQKPAPERKVPDDIFLPLPEPGETTVAPIPAAEPTSVPPPTATVESKVLVEPVPATEPSPANSQRQPETNPFAQSPSISESNDKDTKPAPVSPGQANLQILPAPPASEKDSSKTAAVPPPPEPEKTEPKELSLPPVPTPLDEPTPASESKNERRIVEVQPKMTVPPPAAPDPAGPAKSPECAVPSLAMNDPYADRTNPQKATPFVDPLDQLTYPQSVPEQNNLERHLTVPAGYQETAPPVIETQPTDAGQLPEVTPREFPTEPGAAPISARSDSATTVVEGAERSPEAPLATGPQQPELKIQKIAPPKAVLNQPMIYQIVVRNVGKTAARQVVVEDTVPKGTKLTGTIPRGEMADNRLIWRFDSIPADEEKRISVRVIPTQAGQIGSAAKVSFVAEAAAQTVVAAPKLALKLTGPADATLGDALTYHFDLANEGTGDASNVFLRNVLPAGLTHPSGNDLEYEVGTLKAGEKKGIDLTVNAAKAGEFANKAIVTAAGGLKLESTAKVKILGDRITITRTGPKRRYIGRRAEFANTIANQSDHKVAPVRVVEVVPTGMEFVKASTGGQYDPNARTVTWALAEIGPKQNKLLTLELVAKKEGPQTSQVTAFDPNGSRAVVKSETTVDGYTSLRLNVREYNDPVDVGDQVGVRVVATNRGTRASSNVLVNISIPEEMEFVSAKGPVDFNHEGQSLKFKAVKSLEAGAELAFDVVLKSIKPGDARLGLEIASDQTSKPLSREEAIRILPSRP